MDNSKKNLVRDKIQFKTWLDSLPYLERKQMIKSIQTACFHKNRCKIYSLCSLKNSHKISELEKEKIEQLAGHKIFVNN